MTEYLDTIQALIRKYRSGETLSGEEQLLLETWGNASPFNAEVLNHLEDDRWLAENLFHLENIDTEGMWQDLQPSLKEEKEVRVRRIPWARMAAAVVLAGVVVVSGIYIVRSSRKVAPATVSQNGAVLTLADGTMRYLNDMDTGILTEVGNVRVIKHDSNRLIYEVHGKARPASTTHMVYNTLAVQKGEQFQLILPDSTKVWLNSASSLRYPAIFSDKSREVELTGEAYFEVAKNPGAPFKVKVKDQYITVLGTSFNVKGYPGEQSVQTTLKDGSVAVSKGNSRIILRPGEQAVADSGAAKLRVLTGKDVAGIISWTSGYFQFDDMDIPTAMRELGRCYDMNIIIRPGIASGPLANGTFQRSVSLQKLLNSVERKHLHFRIEGKTIIVEP